MDPDQRAARADAYESVRSEIVDLVPARARRVLDLGCSTGWLATALKERGDVEVVGIEREPAYAKVARERIDSTLPLDESAMRTVPDKRDQPRVAFGTLVESGLVPAGTALTDAKRRWTASVRADGSIACDTHSGSIHKVGAALQNAPSCNGWTFWHVAGAEAPMPLDALRQQYLAAL